MRIVKAIRNKVYCIIYLKLSDKMKVKVITLLLLFEFERITIDSNAINYYFFARK